MVTFIHAGFEVGDFEAWKKGFDATTMQRQIAGEVSHQILRDADHPELLTVISVLKNDVLVRAFMMGPNFEAAMKASGVTQMARSTYWRTSTDLGRKRAPG